MNKERSKILREIENALEKRYGQSLGRSGIPRCVDIHSRKNGKDYYFCVMVVTRHSNNAYFDATVSAEWEFVWEQREKGNEVLFVVYRNDVVKEKRIVVLTPKQVLSCSVPHLTSFQIKFQANSGDLDNPKNLERIGGLIEDNLKEAIKSFNNIKKNFNR